MATGDMEESPTVTNIRTAVTRLGVSLNHSEEATLHVARIRDLSIDIFAYYREAFGDSGSLAVESAAGAVEGVSGLADAVLELLEKARGEIRDYAAMIAPLLPLTDSGKVRDSRSGEELLNTSRRPRTLGQYANTMVREGEDSASIYKASRKAGQGILDLLRPPDPSGLVAATHAPAVNIHHPVPGSAGSGDTAVTVALTIVTAVKILQVTASGIRNIFKRWRGK